MAVTLFEMKKEKNAIAEAMPRRQRMERNALVCVCIAMLLAITWPALCEEAVPYHAVRLSANLTFDGTAYLPDQNEYAVFNAEMALLDGAALEKIVDPNGEHTWTTTERTQLAIPDVLYENELGDSFSVRNGAMEYLRNDATSAVDALANLLSMLYGAPNQQATSDMLWDSQRDPASDFDTDTLKDTGTLDIRLALSVADTAIRKMQLDQEATLVRCETATVGETEYCIAAYGLKVDHTEVYGPCEQRMNITNKDESLSASQESILFVLDQKGICVISMWDGVYQHCSEESKVTIMSDHDALKSLTAILSSDQDNRYTLRQMWLSYLPVGDAYAGKVRFQPFWCFYMEYPNNEETFACTARLDAVTGEEMR